MPELPEVEVTRLGLLPHIVGKQIEQVELGKPLRWPLGCSPSHLVGAQIKGLNRRGKYLLLELNTGWLLIHLGMSGSLQWSVNPSQLGPHDHFGLTTKDGQLKLHDPRRFGAIVFANHLDEPMPQKLLCQLGVEPLEPMPQRLSLLQKLKHRRIPIKQVLLQGNWVVGVGNIYASEALFHAGIRPTAVACRLSIQRLDRLLDAIEKVLQEAIQKGGSSLQNYVQADGHLGQFQKYAQVYAREGEPCHVCQTPIKRMVQANRASYYCPRCQKP